MSKGRHEEQGLGGITFFDFFCIALILISLLSVVSLSVGVFSVERVLIAATVFFLLLVKIAKPDIGTMLTSLKGFPVLSVLILLLIGLFFRVGPYNYVMGGQDQGLYFNMSKIFQESGKVFQHDSFRQSLEEPSSFEIYDENNLKKRKLSPERYEGWYMPGLYIADVEESKYVFQFYHLHPLWMAIFGKVLGDSNRVYSLVFFSLISILAFYLLAFEMSGKKGIAFLVGLLVALNPLHAFFSKFPVTEVMALCFSSLAFYYLVRYYNFGLQSRESKHLLVLSAGMMGCLFFTRISGFMYVPFFYVLLLASELLNKDRFFVVRLRYYVFFVFALYAISILHGMHFSYPYSIDIYRKSFRRAFGSDWPEILWVLMVAMLMVYALTFWSHKLKINMSLSRLSHLLTRCLPYLFFILLAVGCYKVYLLGFTDKYVGHKWIGQRWDMAGNQWNSLSHSSLVVSIFYLSPFVFVLFWYSLFRVQKRMSAPLFFLLLFLLCFWAYILLLQWTVPYQYYYARYLVSEVVPYTLLFVVLSYGAIKIGRGGFAKKIHGALILLACVYSVVISSSQYIGREADGAYAALNRISAHIAEEDMLFINAEGFPYHYHMKIKMPLIYYHGKNVVSVNGPDDIPGLMNDELYSATGDIFVLSHHLIDRPAYRPVDRLVFSYGQFERSKRIPNEFSYKKINLTVYKVDKRDFYNEVLSAFGELKVSRNQYIKTEGFYPEGWTTGYGKISNIEFDVKGKEYLLLKVHGWNPGGYAMESTELKVVVNGQELNYSHTDGLIHGFKLGEVELVKSIEIMSRSFVPQAIGMSADTRTLGIDIDLILFE